MLAVSSHSWQAASMFFYLHRAENRELLEHQPSMRTQLSELRANGELPEFTDEELLTANAVCLWRKP